MAERPLNMYPKLFEERDQSEKDDEEKINFTRAKKIASAVEMVPDVSPDDLATICTKMNQVASLGMINFSPQELASLKTLSQKYIPDAPKQVNLNATVKTEQVIMGWLEGNQDALQKFQEKAIEVPFVEIVGLDEVLK